MDTARLRELLDDRDKIDLEIRELVNGNGTKERKQNKCGHCQAEGHSVRTCPNK